MNKTPTDSPTALQALLDTAPSRHSRIGWRLAGIALLLPAVAWLLKPGGSETVDRYLTDQVTRADLVLNRPGFAGGFLV